ncbi:MAG: OadG family protein [Ignavibacterium sp.]|nr:OadG family protein [Ignavibacterium sp.]MDW8374170.1 OadG family protein [Ignavibacteriales bacterium]
MFLAQVSIMTSDSTSILVHRNSDLFMKIDPYGIGMTVIGYSVVFIALLLLYVIFYNLSKVLALNIKRILRKEGKSEEANKVEEISGEVNAAIAYAIYLYFNELHDKENPVITISRISKAYSPWSSKIYSLRKYPR